MNSHSLSARPVQQQCPPLAAWRVRRGSPCCPQHGGGPCLLSCFDQVRPEHSWMPPPGIHSVCQFGVCRPLHTHDPYVLCPQMTDEQTEAQGEWDLCVVPPLVNGRVDWSLLSAPWDAHPSPLHGEEGGGGSVSSGAWGGGIRWQGKRFLILCLETWHWVGSG